MYVQNNACIIKWGQDFFFKLYSDFEKVEYVSIQYAWSFLLTVDALWLVNILLYVF